MLGAIAAIAVLASGCSLWGSGVYFKIGEGSSFDEHSPVQAGTSTDWAFIADGVNACGIKTDHSLWCWGINPVGDGTDRLTTGTATHIGTATWKFVAPPSDHTCGIQTDDSLWCWGSNGFGELGTGAADPVHPSLSPVHVGTASWKTVSTGSHHTCGIQTDNSLWCWGYNGFGALGNGESGSGGPNPTPIHIGTARWTSVSAGDEKTCAIKTDQTLSCWGRNRRGELGDGTKTTSHSSPVQVGLAQWSLVITASADTCGLHTDATLWCWGDNTGPTGAIGGGFTATGPPFTARLRPGQVGTAHDWIAFSISSGHQCGLRANAGDLTTVWCWGHQHNGQIGNDSTDDVPTPEQIGDPDHYVTVSAGGQSTHTLRYDPEAK